MGPLIDKLVTSDWVFGYTFTQGEGQQLAGAEGWLALPPNCCQALSPVLLCLSGAAATMVASCALAVLVNISQFMCLGRFSAVSFQVGLALCPLLWHIHTCLLPHLLALAGTC